MALGDRSDPILIKQNDTRPQIRYDAKQGPVGGTTPVDLTGCTVVFNMRLDASPFTVVVNRQSGSLVTPATLGGMVYALDVGETATNGLYQAEFEATFADGGILTFPSGTAAAGNDYIFIQIGDDIA